MKNVLLMITLMIATVSMASAQHSAQLTYVASADAAGNPTLTYNVYRASAACSTNPVLTKLVSGISGLTYTDATVTIATGTYCYGVTASLNGNESSMSNLAPAVIPLAGATVLVVITK
jgi:hypothetical protein